MFFLSCGWRCGRDRDERTGRDRKLRIGVRESTALDMREDRCVELGLGYQGKLRDYRRKAHKSLCLTGKREANYW